MILYTRRAGADADAHLRSGHDPGALRQFADMYPPAQGELAGGKTPARQRGAL